MQTKIAIKREQSQARLSYAEREQFGATLKFIFSLAATFITAAVTLGSLTACSSEDLMVADTNNPQAPTYTICIPASMGEGAQTRAVTFNNDATPPTATGSFAASEPVYVYNETKGVMLSGELHPSNISADGKSCNLTGELTGSFDAGDQLTLLYNMIYDDNPDYCFFDYGGQDGSESGVVDGGMATGVSATISGSTLTTDATVTFAMQQAIFRLKFTDGTNPINVKSLIIKCTGSDVASCYNPFNNEPYIYSEQSIKVIPTTATNEYLYVALCINENASPSTLTFTVTDEDGDVYTATKAAPSSGFKNGKYYYSSAATVLTWQKKLVKPTITNITNVDYAGEFGPDLIGNFYYLLPVNNENPVEITISGTSNGYWFSATDCGNAIIHLNNLTATHDSNYFINAVNLTLDISGANSITCKEKAQAIQVNGTLKLMGNGTLTVTANNSDLYGLAASSNYKAGNNSDASVLAAPGYAVTRSATADNGDGTFTWTYTVRPLIDLSSLTGDYTAQDGEILTGEFPSNYNLYIAAGATVTLAGMTHHAGAKINSIVCLGTANIILAEGTTNDLTRGSSDAYAGLFLNNGITWSILTISGTGTLLASGGNACAGIGGINYCDDIVINGGTIYATGGQFAPGIGAGADSGQTGNITINGGNITATGGEGAAGIGTGTNSSECKDITIENTVTRVKAIKGADASESIGRGSGGSCGTVKFGTATMFDDSRWTTTPKSGNNYGLLHFVISTTTNPNDTWTLTPLNQGQGGLQNYNVNPANEQ